MGTMWKGMACALLMTAACVCRAGGQVLSGVDRLGGEDEKAGEKSGEFVPEEARTYARQGNIAFAQGDYEEARKSYEKVLELAPDNLVGMINLGTVFYRMGKVDEAEEMFKRALRRRLETAPAWMMLGMIALEAGNLDAAHAALSQAALYDPGNPRTRNYLGVAVGRKGWYDAAEAELRKAIEIDPAYADAHFNLAVFYMERKPPAVELAKRHYQRALQLGTERDSLLENNIKKADAKRANKDAP